ncbi:MAG: hypothetical protein WAT34_11420, partial [Chitinophagaceae bacterium]
MNKIILSIALSVMISFFFTNCNKNEVKAPVGPKIVYAAGSQYIGRDVATVWKDSVATTLTDGTSNASGNSVFVSGSDVYVAGYEQNNSGSEVAKIWKNGTATALTDGTLDAILYSVYA